MFIYAKTVMVSMLLAFLLVLSGCDEGPAERAGEEVDDAVENVGDKIEDAGDAVKDATN